MSTPVVINSGPTFHENASKYKCCCNLLHVKVAVIIIGVVEAVQCFGGVAGLASRMHDITLISDDTNGTYNVKGVYGAGLAFELLECIVVVALFVAIFLEHPILLIPHMAMQVLGLIILLGLIAVFIYVLAAGSSNDFADAMISGMENLNIRADDLSLEVRSFLLAVCIPMIFCLLAWAILDVWWLVEIIKCYQFFKAKRAWIYKSGTPTAKATYSAGGGYFAKTASARNN